MKPCDKMDFEEFARWAQEYIVTCFLDRGLGGIKDGIRTVIIQVNQNTVFGGAKKK